MRGLKSGQGSWLRGTLADVLGIGGGCESDLEAIRYILGIFMLRLVEQIVMLFECMYDIYVDGGLFVSLRCEGVPIRLSFGREPLKRVQYQCVGFVNRQMFISLFVRFGPKSTYLHRFLRYLVKSGSRDCTTTPAHAVL